MRLVISTEVRLLRTPDGRVWTSTGAGYPFWSRYLMGFDRVRVVARVLDLAAAPPDAVRADGENVEVWPVPHYVGPAQYAHRLPALRRAVRGCAEPGDTVILRLPSPIGNLVAAWCRRRRLAYAVEVVGDPYDVFAPGVVRHPLRWLVRLRAVRVLRRLCAEAVGVAYVTEQALQRRYPAGPAALTTHFSSGVLDERSYVERPRPAGPRRWPDAPYTLVSVGSLEQLYKGIDVLIEAVARLNRRGVAVRLIHVGEGRYLPRLAALAARRGVADRVTLTGPIAAGAGVRAVLDAADLFVMPSRTEGLPRAMIEAMARALPVIGTRVGGIPELVEDGYLVDPDDPAGLAGAIADLLGDPVRLAAASAANLARARDYAAATLLPRRAAWYRALAGGSAVVPHARTAPTPTVRVLHVIGTLNRGGAEMTALSLCRQLPAEEIRQIFATLGAGEGELAAQFRSAGAEVVRCPLSPRPGFPARLWRCLRAQRPDVVISHVSLASGFVLGLARLAGVPVRVARMHSEGDGNGVGLRRRLQRFLLRHTLAWSATDVVAVTASALTFAGARAGDNRYRVMYNGVDPDRLAGPERTTARARLGLPEQPPIIVHIGRAAPEKNRGFLIDLHRAAQRIRPDVLLLVVGPGGRDDILAAHPRVGHDPSVVFLGDRPDVGVVLAAADALVLPSVREGLPGVVLEALASGRPVVATDLPGLREVGREVVGLHLLGLSEPAERWAEVALDLAGLDAARRERIRQTLLTSPFTAEQATRAWEALCLRGR